MATQNEASNLRIGVTVCSNCRLGSEALNLSDALGLPLACRDAGRDVHRQLEVHDDHEDDQGAGQGLMKPFLSFVALMILGLVLAGPAALIIIPVVGLFLIAIVVSVQYEAIFVWRDFPCPSCGETYTVTRYERIRGRRCHYLYCHD